MATNLLKRIQKFNKNRDAELLKLKYARMRVSPFTFLRGSCHLFYEDWQGSSILNNAPLGWICGDLHLQNFGSYEGEKRLIYFDINDFDEAALAPCSLDIIRLLTSIFLSFSATEDREKLEAQDLCNLFLDAYLNSLVDGKARWVDLQNSTGLVKKVIEGERKRGRKRFLDSRTVLKDDRRQILIRDEKTRPINDEQKSTIATYLEKYAEQQDNPKFYKFIDAAWRIAGTGSLGLERYIVLVEGDGSPDRNFLIDIKQAQKPSLTNYLKFPQPKWMTEAHRVVSLQKRCQAIAIACLNTIDLKGSHYIIRELQPSEDRVDLEQESDRPKKIKQLMTSLGQIVAWSLLRSSGREGSANADELIKFSQSLKWRKKAIEYARDYSKQVQSDWQKFCDETENI
jgi:uncharacterized protein (DUF2252 family)